MGVADGDRQRVANHEAKLGKLALDLTADEAVTSISHAELFNSVGQSRAVNGLQKGHLLIGNQAVIGHERHYLPRNEFLSERQQSNRRRKCHVSLELRIDKQTGRI